MQTIGAVPATKPDIKELEKSEPLDIKEYVLAHKCAQHPLFSYLRGNELSQEQIKNLLRNYDAHAGLLRRLLLKAATLMPDSAVGFILENVRNEYGNGSFEHCHQAQLLDLAAQTGISATTFQQAKITRGVRSFMKKAPQFYYPRASNKSENQHSDTKQSATKKSATSQQSYLRAAIAAGAITTTEILALEEFKALQCAFVSRHLQNHIWFDHVNVEAEHTAESIQLALHFSERSWNAVKIGIDGMLEATYDLYDGLMQAARG
jgi:hypothetical protein